MHLLRRSPVRLFPGGVFLLNTATTAAGIPRYRRVYDRKRCFENEGEKYERRKKKPDVLRERTLGILSLLTTRQRSASNASDLNDKR
jgi:hypothetical protein